MSEKPLISILTPSFNHEKYVSNFISSIIAQTYLNWELIIVDDCSTDGNVEEIKKFSDSRIHLFIQDFNQGPGAALNKAFSESHGEIIVDMASDDMLYPDYFEYIVKTFNDNPEVGGIYSSLDVIDENNRVYKKYQLPHFKTRIDFLRDLFCKGNVLFSPGLSARREIYSTIIPMDASMVQHQDYQWHVLFLGQTECIVAEKPFVMYRQPRKKMANLSRVSLPEHNRCRLEADNLMNSFLKIHDLCLIKQITGSELCDLLSDDCTDFIWGMSALKIDSPEKKQWGYKVVSKVYSDSNYRKILNNKLNYRFADFLELANTKYYKDSMYLFHKIKQSIKKFLGR